MSQVIAKYENLVYSCFCLKSNGFWHAQFLDFFEGTDLEFIKKYKQEFPNYSIQIFNSKKRPLFQDLRFEIEELIKQPPMQKNIREYNLNKLI